MRIAGFTGISCRPYCYAGAMNRSEPLSYRRADAAKVLGMSLDSFERYVQPEVRLVRRGGMRLVPRTELEAWLDKNAERVI
jgi:hypothetical protein